MCNEERQTLLCHNIVGHASPGRLAAAEARDYPSAPEQGRQRRSAAPLALDTRRRMG